MNEPPPILLSHYQAVPLLEARAQRLTLLPISTDLGMTQAQAQLDPAGVTFPTGETLTWDDVARIAESDNGCFLLRAHRIEKVQVYSETTARPISLMPTAGPPTLLIAGFPMHRIKGTDPGRDTESKIKALAPVSGRVLDTNTGLGYTAIALSRSASEVVTIELDPGVLEIARVNPWSGALFTQPNIRQIVGDSFEEVQNFDDGAFDRILHDPPTFSLAGDLYAADFYRALYRILAPHGRLFHYIGDLDSDSGRRVARGVVERLQKVGFQKVTRRNDAFGLVAGKQEKE